HPPPYAFDRTSPSTFDNAHRAQARDLSRESGLVYYLDHLVDVFIRLGHFLNNTVLRFASNDDPLTFQALLYYSRVVPKTRSAAAEQPSGAMADTSERLVHGTLGADEDP